MESKEELDLQLGEARVEYAEALVKISEIKKKMAFIAFVASERQD